MTKLQVTLLLAFLFAVYGLLGRSEAVDEDRYTDFACRMVETYIETDGERGWPPGPGYNEICKNGETDELPNKSSL